MIAHSDKRRYEIAAERIRALYGHSFGNKLVKEVGVPPDILFHGTSFDSYQLIQEESLRPMKRQYVHLSSQKKWLCKLGFERQLC